MGLKFAKQQLPKPKIRDPLMRDDRIFSKNALIQSSHIAL